MTTTARRLIVHGIVQGVFYRDSCHAEAERLGVTGWVRNQPDGTVAVHAEGAPEAVAQLERWCRTGSRRARVQGVETEDAPVEGHRRFEVR